MTSEELVVAGVPPTGEDTRDSGSVQSRVDDPTGGIIPDFGIHEEREIRSEERSGGEEDLSNVDADVNELVGMKTRSYPPTFVFGESKVTADLIKEYEEARFFLAPEANEVVVFRDFFTCGLRFPCDPLLPCILEKFSVKKHQLTPNSVLELSKFFWIMKTFECNFGVDIFAHLFELVIEKDIIQH
jgi:hypothetical protein